MPSLPAKIADLVMNVFDFREITLRKTKNIKRKKGEVTPFYIRALFAIERYKYKQKETITLLPKKEKNKKHIFYLHGGGYVFGIYNSHWLYAMKLSNKLTCKVSILDYPLGPEHNYSDTFEMLENTYRHLLEKYPDDEFIFMGDSAGGGLALAFSLKIKKEKILKQSIKNVLLFPWLDMTGTNPLVVQYSKKCRILLPEMLYSFREKYAPDADYNNYLLSPIKGDLDDLPETVILCGTHDTLYSDFLALKNKSSDSNTKFHFHSFEGMQHAWTFFPIPEAREAFKVVCDFMDE